MSALLKECFRWFGPTDPVTLSEIVQCGCEGVYTSLHDIPSGDCWSEEAIRDRIETLAEHGLTWEAVESVPVTEAIKSRSGDYEKHLENYRQTLINLGNSGVRCVVYNFMPGMDWVRTDLDYRLPDGKSCLRYDPVQFAAFECFVLQREGAEADYTEQQLAKAEVFFRGLADVGAFERSITDLFPGSKLGLSLDGFRDRLAPYAKISAADLREHHRQFLEAVVPVAESVGVKLAVHPDDPPFSVLGLPRVVSTSEDVAGILSMVDSPANGLCFCTGSFGARQDTDLAEIVRRSSHRIYAVHLRAVQHEGDGAFHEADHLGGAVNMPELMSLLLQENDRRPDGSRLSFRPDHGHRMLSDLDRPANPNPGYDCVGRMRSLAELRGVQHALVWSKGLS